MKRRSLMNVFAASAAAAFVLVFSLSANALAWSDEPFAGSGTETTTIIEDEENPEDIVPEDEDIEEEQSEETTAAPEETTVASEEIISAPEETTTEPLMVSPVETTQQAGYSPVDSYTMYAPQVINVRSGPGTDYDKMGVLYANSAVTVIGTSGDWFAISYEGQTGFVLGSLLTATEPQTTTAPAETEPQPQETEATTTVATAEIIETTDAIEASPVEDNVQTTKAPEAIQDEMTTTVVAAASNTVTTPFPPVLLALLCAVGVFLVVAVIPITIHKIHHRNLYRY